MYFSQKIGECLRLQPGKYIFIMYKSLPSLRDTNFCYPTYFVQAKLKF